MKPAIVFLGAANFVSATPVRTLNTKIVYSDSYNNVPGVENVQTVGTPIKPTAYILGLDDCDD